jgi:hypothetical protein
VKRRKWTEKEKENIFIFIVDATDLLTLEKHFMTLPFAASSPIDVNMDMDMEGTTSSTTSQQDPVVKFDIFIDDGSHRNQDVINVFENMFLKYIKPSGTYVVEDTHCSYDQLVHAGPPDLVPVSKPMDFIPDSKTMMEYFQSLVDVMHIYRIMEEYTDVSTTGA